MNKEKIMTFVKKSLRFLPDKVYIKLYYRLRVGRKLNMGNPETLNEKLQWLKFNYRFPLQSIVSDKLLVRDYVKEKIGEKYLISLLGSWKEYSDIDFSALPNQFVLKCNHDSGGLVVCTDKEKLNHEEAKKKIEKSLRSNFFYIGREYQYRNIKPMIICEKFISDNGKVPMDYKIYCFNGKPDVILVCRDRFSKNTHRASYLFFDQKWNFQPLDKGDENLQDVNIPKPENLDEMIEIAKKLSEDFVFARIDLYNIKGKIYFGEITLSPNSGFDPDIKYETDLMFGQKLEIPYWNDINRAI
ncbi:ATP-grasp fold amidoligase family protein [Clostridium sp. AF32-12BH]|uniref:ATP-grasp fold amidoligase family protein n=1 Tax=Clostridium sp. AF32-12BH TaxID=2292006 RepID=UPI000E4C84B0|nr:ATP-grasp fold amidoligase family protein [Clostridium sp. AF32-12BH]RHP47279.1 glycosyl transferase [Clostridium sp. AF32-12BH]